MPEWERAKADHPDVPFAAISIVREERLVSRFAEQHGLTEPYAVSTGNVLEVLGIAGVPAIAILSEGQVVALAPGGASAGEIAAQISRFH